MKLFNLSTINSIVASDIHAHLAANVFGRFDHEIKSLCGNFVILLHLTNGADHAQYNYTVSLTTKCGKVLKSVKHENANVTKIKECLRSCIIEWNTNNPELPEQPEPTAKPFIFEVLEAYQKTNDYAIKCWWLVPEINNVLLEGEKLGFVCRVSTTQLFITQKGCEAYNEARKQPDITEADLVDGSTFISHGSTWTIVDVLGNKTVAINECNRSRDFLTSDLLQHIHNGTMTFNKAEPTKQETEQREYLINWSKSNDANSEFMILRSIHGELEPCDLKRALIVIIDKHLDERNPIDEMYLAESLDNWTSEVITELHKAVKQYEDKSGSDTYKQFIALPVGAKFYMTESSGVKSPLLTKTSETEYTGVYFGREASIKMLKEANFILITHMEELQQYANELYSKPMTQPEPAEQAKAVTIINDKPEDQKLSIKEVFESFNLKLTTHKNLTVITNYCGDEICRITGSNAERMATKGLIRDAIEEGRDNDTQPCQAYQDFAALPVGAEFQQVFTGSAHNAIFDCTKVSDSDFTTTETGKDLLTYDRGWSTSSVHTNLLFNTRDFNVDELKEELRETKQVNIEFVNGDDWITLHVQDMNNYFDCCIEHYINGEIVNDICEDRFIANGYTPVVAKLKQFIIDMQN